MNELITLTLTWTIPEHRAELFWKNPPSVTIGGMQVDLQSHPAGTQGRPGESKATEPSPLIKMRDAAPSPSGISTPDAVEPMKGLMPGKFYTLKEVAAHMRCSPKTIYRLVQVRELIPCRFSRHYRFKGSTVIAYLEQRISRK